MQRKEQLLDIAEALFAQRGFEGVSIEDIARAADVSRTVVYQYYGSRERVFLACVARARHQFNDRLLERVRSAGAYLSDQIRAGGGAYFDLVEDDPEKFGLLFTASASLSGELSDELSTLRTTTIQVIADIARQHRPTARPEAITALAFGASGIGEQIGRWWLTTPTMPKWRVLDYYSAAVKGTVEGILAVPSSPARSQR